MVTLGGKSGCVAQDAVSHGCTGSAMGRKQIKASPGSEALSTEVTEQDSKEHMERNTFLPNHLYNPKLIPGRGRQ